MANVITLAHAAPVKPIFGIRMKFSPTFDAAATTTDGSNAEVRFASMAGTLKCSCKLNNRYARHTIGTMRAAGAYWGGAMIPRMGPANKDAASSTRDKPY